MINKTWLWKTSPIFLTDKEWQSRSIVENYILFNHSEPEDIDTLYCMMEQLFPEFGFNEWIH